MLSRQLQYLKENMVLAIYFLTVTYTHPYTVMEKVTQYIDMQVTDSQPGLLPQTQHHSATQSKEFVNVIFYI